MINITQRPLFLYFCVLLFTTLYSCNNQKKITVGADYSLYILGKDDQEYLVETNMLDSGIIEPAVTGVVLDGKDMDRDVFAKNGFFYHLNRKNTLFSKFALTADSLRATAKIKLPGFSLENFSWISPDTLLLTGLNTSGYNMAKYYLIEISNFKIIKSGNLAIPKPRGKFKSISIGFVNRRDQSIFIGYTYNFPISISDYSTSDTMYVSKLKFPEMEFLKTDKDTRSTYPGGENAIQSYSFTNYTGDYYFMSCPGIALGNRPDLSTGIFRITKDTDQLDSDYFFDISESKIGNHAYGIWYLGGNKAIIRSERKDLFTGLGDHYSIGHFEFYVLDLITKSVEKLNLPLDKGTRKECVLVEGNKAYIAVNSAKDGNYIWVYDILKKTLKKGVQLGGDTDFILRIDKLKK